MIPPPPINMFKTSEVYGPDMVQGLKKKEIGLGLGVLDLVSSAMDSVTVMLTPLSSLRGKQIPDLHGAQTIITKTETVVSNTPCKSIEDIASSNWDPIKFEISSSTDSYCKSSELSDLYVAGYMDYDPKAAAMSIHKGNGLHKKAGQNTLGFPFIDNKRV